MQPDGHGRGPDADRGDDTAHQPDQLRWGRCYLQHQRRWHWLELQLAAQPVHARHQQQPGSDKSRPARCRAVHVVVADPCGDSITNSASLGFYNTTTATPLQGAVKNLGDSITFSTVASGTGPFTYVWKKNDAIIGGATGASLTLTNLAYSDDATYTVEVTGTCNTAVQSAKLTSTIRRPSTSSTRPTAPSSLSPANLHLEAIAQDTDGYVVKVEFFLGTTNKLGDATNGAPWAIDFGERARGPIHLHCESDRQPRRDGHLRPGIDFRHPILAADGQRAAELQPECQFVEPDA